jgi:peptide/nickel transport system substrate-binding protein
VNPVLAATDIDKNLVRLLFANILALAEKVEPSSDRRTWDIRLKENLIWQDGEKLTSDDALFTIQKIQDPESRSPLALSWQGITARRVSALELNIYLPSPYAFFENNLSNLYILPKHLFADIPPANWRLSEYNLKPIGAGPYRFEGYARQPDGFIEAYRLHSWKQAPGGVPNVTLFDVHFFRNAGDQLKSFNAGKLDGFGNADAALIKGIRRPYTLHAFTTPSYYAAFLNTTHAPVLQDPAVRAALAQGVNRDALIAHALGGYGTPVEGPLPGRAAVSSTTPPNAEELRTILENAGWKKSTSTAARVKLQGKTSTALTLTLTVPEVPFLVTTAEALRDAWVPLGVNTTVSPMHPDDILGNIIKNRDYDILLFGNVLNPPEDLFPFWHSSQRFFPGLNISLMNNKRVDSLTESVREETEAVAREEGLAALAALIEKEHPAVFLYSPSYLLVTAKNVGGVEPRAIENPPARFSNVSSWYVKTERVLK